MTPGEIHRDQRSRVRASLFADELRDHHRDVYAKHPLAQVVPIGQPTVASVAKSAHELADMMLRADDRSTFNDRMVDLELVADRLGGQLDSLRSLIRRDWQASMGGPAA